MTARLFDWVSFRGKSPKGERRRGSLEQFVQLLTTCHSAPHKDLAPGFSPTAYRQHYVHETYSEISKKMISFDVDAPAAHRSNAGVERLCALVQDVDHVPVDVHHLERTGSLIIVHSTWSDAPGDPHARVIVPLAIDVLAEEWPSCWQLGLERFDPHADVSCQDVSRFYYLPAAKPLELDRIRIQVIDGELWTPSGLTAAPPATETVTLRPAVDRAATSEETAVARRMLESTCRRLARHPAGAGRQVKAYGTARYIGHLIASGAIDEEEALAALEQALGVDGGNGLLIERDYEARRAVARGLAKGQRDGAFDFGTPLPDFVRVEEVRYG